MKHNSAYVVIAVAFILAIGVFWVSQRGNVRNPTLGSTPDNGNSGRVGSVSHEKEIREVSGIEMAYVAPGAFARRTEFRLLHIVKITKPFWIGKYEVTQSQWEKVMGSNPSYSKGGNLPIEQVGWDDCMAFCAKLTGMARQDGLLPDGYECRLPTEAEWEYACRGGRKSQNYIYSGSNVLDEVGWYYVNSGDIELNDSGYQKIRENHCRTHEVGGKKGNELGLYDMSGNVYEWCYDYWGGFRWSTTEKDPVVFANEGGHVVRGGGWGDEVGGYESNLERGTPHQGYQNNQTGFRFCIGPAIQKPADVK